MDSPFNTQLRTYTKMTEAETIGAFIDFAKMTASAMRELADANDSPELAAQADMVMAIGKNALTLASMRGMTRQEINEALHLKTRGKIKR